MLAARALGVETPALGLVRLRDDSLALLVRRFDRDDDGRRLPLEDLCQLAEKRPADKYDGSAELCVRLIRLYSAAPPIDLLRHWKLQVVSWWLGNGDLHLKNLSLLLRAPREPRLSPAYDLVNTRLVIPNDRLALPVGGKRDNLTAASWRGLAAYSDLAPPLVAAESKRLVARSEVVEALLAGSFLPDAQRDAYLELFRARRPVVEALARLT
jgi:serine/threonine-protein kinase HipA